MTMRKVIFLGPPDLQGFVAERLGSAYAVIAANEEVAVRRHLHDADFVLDAYMRVRFNADMIASASRLRAFVAATTGADHVDKASLDERAIPLLTLRGETELLRELTPAAELTWLLIMACARNVRAAFEDVLAGVWDRNRHPGMMLRGRTLGIIGCGRIGQWVARYAEAFGMRRLGYDPHILQWPAGVERCTLDRVLAGSDVVSVHVPLNESTRGLLGEREIGLMKAGAILVNTSRGEITDELAIIKALSRDQLRAVGVDVLCGEPDVNGHPLLEYARAHPNVVITPHIGGFSPDAVRTVLDFCCSRIEAFGQT